MRVAELLHGLGASLRAVDPYVEPHRIPDYIALCDLTPETVQTADAIVILTEHEGLDYSLIEAAPCFVLDTRRRLAGVRESI
jgi:UDP-N-acetyl-D-mannosaminuronate dehydrogenase